MGVAALQNSLSAKQQQVNKCTGQIAQYQQIVDELQRIHHQLEGAKSDLKHQKTRLVSFGFARYQNWKGTHFEKKYKEFITRKMQRDYDAVIKQIDKNMAIVNKMKADYQNRIYRNEGLIGQLKAAINSLVTQIENWVD